MLEPAGAGDYGKNGGSSVGRLTDVAAIRGDEDSAHFLTQVPLLRRSSGRCKWNRFSLFCRDESSRRRASGNSRFFLPLSSPFSCASEWISHALFLQDIFPREERLAYTFPFLLSAPFSSLFSPRGSLVDSYYSLLSSILSLSLFLSLFSRLKFPLEFSKVSLPFDFLVPPLSSVEPLAVHPSL